MLVSCIMPTANRPLAQAILWFEAQDYPDKELIIDDGPGTVGEKRNRCCEKAKGGIIAHCDDDDWYAPWRLSFWVRCLTRGERTELCGLKRPLFYDQANKQAYELIPFAVRQPWVYGATLVYLKSAWEERRFADITSGEDTDFVWKFREDQVYDSIHGQDTYVGLLHRGNTGPLRHQRHLLLPVPVSRITEVMGEDRFGGDPHGTEPYRDAKGGDGFGRDPEISV
jgi:glycosyltransferase involved in cell wall biosynthesis